MQTIESTWKKVRALALYSSLIVWLFGVTGGMVALVAYAAEPCPGIAVEAWPVDNEVVKLKRESLNLVMMIHPKCPCSRASLIELRRVLDRKLDVVEATVLMYCPESKSVDWAKTDLWQLAIDATGKAPVVDWAARNAKLFGASGSGHVVVYNGKGEYLFGGGITSSRGHEGDNAGKQSITEIIAGNTPKHTTTPVFGCPFGNDSGAPGHER